MIKLKKYWAHSLIGILILITGSFSILVFNIYYQSRINEIQKAEAIVVLGTSQWNGQPSPMLKSRLDHALYLYQNNFARKIILTGGIGQNETLSESHVSKNYLIEKDIDETIFFIEEKGQTTLQSLKEVKKILEEQNLDSVILVSNGFHIMRAKKMCRDLDIKTLASPVVSKNKVSEFRYVLREAMVYLLYLVFKV